MPFYPVMPCRFWPPVRVLGLDIDAKIYAGVWFLLGLVIYFTYGFVILT